MFGEVRLSGAVRPVGQTEARLKEAQSSGLTGGDRAHRGRGGSFAARGPQAAAGRSHGVARSGRRRWRLPRRERTVAHTHCRDSCDSKRRMRAYSALIVCGESMATRGLSSASCRLQSSNLVVADHADLRAPGARPRLHPRSSVADRLGRGGGRRVFALRSPNSSASPAMSDRYLGRRWPPRSRSAAAVFLIVLIIVSLISDEDLRLGPRFAGRRLRPHARLLLSALVRGLLLVVIAYFFFDCPGAARHQD